MGKHQTEGTMLRGQGANLSVIKWKEWSPVEPKMLHTDAPCRLDPPAIFGKPEVAIAPSQEHEKKGN